MSKRIKYADEPMEATVIPDFLPPPGQMRHSQNAPRLVYSKRADALRMRFTDRPVERRVRAPGGVVLEYDAAGGLTSVVFHEASKRFPDPEQPVAVMPRRKPPRKVR